MCIGNVFKKNSPTVYTLTDAVVEAMSDYSGICAACYFTTNSVAVGCAIALKNDENTIFFNISHSNVKDRIELKCFSAPEAGEFSVFVYELQGDGTFGHDVIKLQNVTVRLPDVTTAGEDSMQQRGISPCKRLYC